MTYTPAAKGLTPYYGQGTDGDVVISTNTTLTQTMHYESLLIESGAVVTIAGDGTIIRARTSITLEAGATIESNGTDGQAALGATNYPDSGIGGAGGCNKATAGATGAQNSSIRYGGGGGGGGGSVILCAPVIIHDGLVSADGGDAGATYAGAVSLNSSPGVPLIPYGSLANGAVLTDPYQASLGLALDLDFGTTTIPYSTGILFACGSQGGRGGGLSTASGGSVNGAGGGTGGSIIFVCKTKSGSGTTSVVGGTGVAGYNAGTTGPDGADGVVAVLAEVL